MEGHGFYRQRAILMVLAVGIPSILALVASKYWLFVFGQFAVIAMVTTGLNVSFGMSGVLSMISPAFLAIGAYGSVLGVTVLHLPLAAAALVSVILSAAFGWLLGLINTRIVGLQFAIITLGFLLVFQSILIQGGELTGGTYGLVAPDVSLPLIGAVDDRKIALAAIFAMVLVAGSIHFLSRSNIGQAMVAMKMQPGAAELSGVNLARLKAISMFVSGGVIAFAGIFHSFLLGVTQPDAYGVNLALFHLTIVVVAGASASVASVLIASAILFLLPELFLWLGKYRDLFYPTLMLTVLIFAPRGLAGFFRGVRNTLMQGKTQT
jgi:ABC-type branched-subunit amino acid transport system permease subunit